MKTYKIGDRVIVRLEPKLYKLVVIETQTEADYYNGVEMLKANAEIPGE